MLQVWTRATRPAILHRLGSEWDQNRVACEVQGSYNERLMPRSALGLPRGLLPPSKTLNQNDENYDHIFAGCRRKIIALRNAAELVCIVQKNLLTDVSNSSIYLPSYTNLADLRPRTAVTRIKLPINFQSPLHFRHSARTLQRTLPCTFTKPSP